MSKILYIVVPCYNEEAVLYETAKLLSMKVKNLIAQNKISGKSKIVFVNDGSRDNTWSIIKELYVSGGVTLGINLSRNRGHQNALLAGLMIAKDYADMVISLDADLQDDIDAIDLMVEKYYDGADIVYGIRSKRNTDTFFKRFTAEGFYKFIKFLGADIISDHADYRLMSKRALEGLAEFKEVNLFLRGLVPMIGYRTEAVYYERKERFAGISKYPLKKMLLFALQGITSLTIEPIRMITKLGILLVIISIFIMIWSIIQYFDGNTVAGWSSTIISIWFIGGLILFSLGIVGEYIGKIYLETKHRPRYIISDFLNDIESNSDRKSK